MRAQSAVQNSPLASGTGSAIRTSSNQLAVRWAGNTSSVQTVYIAVLDANRQPIQQQAITQLPVQANLSISSAARYYGVKIVFAGGTASTMMLAIR